MTLVAQGPERPQARLFLRFAAGILLGTAALKTLELLVGPVERSPRDVVMGFLTIREVLLLAAVLEVVVAVVVLRFMDSAVAWFALAYFTFCASLYQAALFALGGPPCGCLGAAASILGMDAQVSAYISKAILVGFWIGIAGFTATGWRLKKPVQSLTHHEGVGSE